MIFSLHLLSVIDRQGGGDIPREVSKYHIKGRPRPSSSLLQKELTGSVIISSQSLNRHRKLKNNDDR